MRILCDHRTPWPLRNYLSEPAVDTAFARGWSEFSNGKLLDHAEKEGFQVLITTDQNMQYEQNLSHRRMAIVVLLSNRWPSVRLRTDEIRAVLDDVKPGELKEVPI